MGKLDGRTAIVTGAAYGDRAALGSAFAKALAAEGANVTVADVKDTTPVADDIAAAGGKALPLTVDVTNEGQIRYMVAKTVDHFGGLEILVNNAGLGSNIPQIPVTEMTVEQWDELMAVNVRGPFLCTKAAVPQMQKQGYGKIINLGSITMMKGLTHRLHYTSAKGAVLAMSRSLAAELGKDGIRVNTIAFGLITSQLNEEKFATEPEFEAAIMGSRALQVHYRAEDVTGGIVFLASPDSDHMTGQCLVMDAGEYFY